MNPGRSVSFVPLVCALVSAPLAPLAHAAGPVESAPAAQSDAKTQLDYILDNPLQESEYGRPDRCLFPHTYNSVEVLDSRHLLFIGNRDTVWLNQLRNDCVGLRKDSLLVFEMHDHSICDLDGFHSAPRFGGLSGDFSVHCTLGHFERISSAQADVLRNAFARRTKAPREQEPDTGKEAADDE